MAVEEDLGRHRHLAGGLCPECLFQNVDDVAHPEAEGVEIGFGNALRLKRFRDEIDDGQPAASMAMLDTDLAAGRLIRGRIDWPPVCADAERLSAVMTAGNGVRTIDLLHVAAALGQAASGLVSLDHRQRAAARVSGLEVVELSS